jgi:hypothetical protein
MGKNPNSNRTASRKHYATHKSDYLARNREQKKRKQEYIRSLKDRPCADCGIAYPHYIMEFDHIEAKSFNLTMTSKSWKQIEAEVGKCEVVCSNCHSARTWFRRQPHGPVAQPVEASGSEPDK